MTLDPRTTDLPGYDYGLDTVARSPVTPGDLAELEQLLHFGEEDVHHLRRIGDMLDSRLEDFDTALMAWVGSVAMASAARESDGTIDERYLERAHARFVRGFVDMCVRPHDQAWLDYQHEVGLRHTRGKKNLTDGAEGVSPHIPFRWIVAFLYPTVQVIRPFLRDVTEDPAEADSLLQAWAKALTLQVALYSHAYVRPGDW